MFGISFTIVILVFNCCCREAEAETECDFEILNNLRLDIVQNEERKKDRPFRKDY
jgi:hypothetical protein